MGYTKTHLEEFVEALYIKIGVSRPAELDIEFLRKGEAAALQWPDN